MAKTWQSTTDLIKTVRGLDQTGPGSDGENLQLLWRSLAAASDGKFHAAEESCLRWLLKSMSGSSQGAETLRRYPLAWTILDCVFQRIPLFSLAKSLADRKFIAVLQQTLKNVSTPVAASGSPTSPKRKRTPALIYALVDLKTQDRCLDTARAVFGTLKSLLRRLEDPEMSLSRDKIGAEHIKSLFCTSSTDAAMMVASAFAVCGNLLTSGTCDKVEGAQDWIESISTIWDLHLHGSDDTLDVATHIFKSSSTILSMIGVFHSSHEMEIPETLKCRWRVDLERFMHRNFILPGRAAFVNRRVFEPFEKSLQVSEDIIQQSAPALYFLSSGVSSLMAEGDLRKDNVEWIKKIFQAVEKVIRGRSDRSALMQTILDQAIQRSTPVDLDDLRRVCREYALQGAETDWDLVAKVAACEPDVFQLSEDGVDLRREICNRTVKHKTSESDYKAISGVIGAIMDGFRTRRDFPGFLELWYEQLCEAERQKLVSKSPWFEVARRKTPKQGLDTFIEAEMSVQQLLGVIAWVETKNPKSHPHSICVFSSTIAQALGSQSFVDAVGRRLFDLVAPASSSSGTAALKWRVVSKTISWTTQDERLEVWSAVKDRLSKILKTAPLMSGETFEAFKCCYQAWDSMSPDDEHIDEPASFVKDFTVRLAAEISTSGASDGTSLSTVWPEMKAELHEESAYRQYIAWYLYGSSRFSNLYYDKNDEMPPVLSNALSTRKASVDELQTLWHALLHNEINLNDPKLARDLVDRLIEALDESEKEMDWPGEQGQMWMKTLVNTPLDVYNRGQRERLMAVLSNRRAKMVKSPKRVSQDGWKLVFGLATKMMGRPTFYDGMGFSDLVEIAEAMSSISTESPTGHGALLELIERFSLMASATIRQMAEHIEERSVDYFRGASKFVSGCETQASAQQEASKARYPLYITLLKALSAELSRSPNCRSHEELGPLLQASRTVLASCIMAVTSNFMSDKKLLVVHDRGADMSLFAAVDAAQTVGDFAGLVSLKTSAVRKLDKRSKDIMQQGDLRGWKIQVFLRNYLSSEVEVPRPASYDSLESLPSQLREPLLEELVTSVTRNMSGTGKFQYLKELLDAFSRGSNTDGQLLAIQSVIGQLIDSTDFQGHVEGFNLAAAHSELTTSLLKMSHNTTHVCRILRALLEKRPQAMSQWNIELTLNTVCDLTSASANQSNIPFSWLCKLVEVVIKKHRLRLEGHYHLLLSTMQALLRNLVMYQESPKLDDKLSQESKAHLYTRLVTLICEPTAGAVSRSQLHGTLDSATDAAKRSAGRHMYMVLMQYVKLQLEESVPRAVREALEPAMNSIFDITSPEGRKILNDAMDSSGRAILREMFKRYVKFGKWSGV
ncbi:Nucleolar pre-ribosomal-associated protein 2 [Tolypocladium capitatum]|uniref:Nucleolar pre-ribosomal-associated protein 2 n=1 Tax=Tolypocladium capitatum TaxID=45235 RepID=A0A2K3Q800_9HYPO|nr:Nucleolar pre-ribosomal-associated protein 2 [Tolypocladium capitatum]